MIKSSENHKNTKSDLHKSSNEEIIISDLLKAVNTFRYRDKCEINLLENRSKEISDNYILQNLSNTTTIILLFLLLLLL